MCFRSGPGLRLSVAVAAQNVCVSPARGQGVRGSARCVSAGQRPQPQRKPEAAWSTKSGVCTKPQKGDSGQRPLPLAPGRDRHSAAHGIQIVFGYLAPPLGVTCVQNQTSPS